VSDLDVLILGPVPPPFGGIGVHVDRLVPLLQRAGLRVGVLNHFRAVERPFVLGALKRNPLNYYRLPKKISTQIVHYHHSHWLAIMAVALGKGRSGSRYIVTLHGNALASRLNSRIPLLSRVTRWALRRFDVIIVVNPHIRNLIHRHIEGRHIDVIPAFLEAAESAPPYDDTTETFLSSGTTLLVPIYQVQFCREGRDLYGLDTVVEAFSKLAVEREDLRIAFFIANRPKRRKACDYLSGLVERVEQVGLGGRVLMVFDLPLTPAFRHDVLVVRATRAEGDAVSVREAISAKVPVVASDVVIRPPEVMTFLVNDSNDLCRALRLAFDEMGSGRGSVGGEAGSPSGSGQFLASLMQIYRSQLRAIA
jgi:glycosyltransferase involved in cell wall biosynthesis